MSVGIIQAPRWSSRSYDYGQHEIASSRQSPVPFVRGATRIDGCATRLRMNWLCGAGPSLVGSFIWQNDSRRSMRSGDPEAAMRAIANNRTAAEVLVDQLITNG